MIFLQLFLPDKKTFPDYMIFISRSLENASFFWYIKVKENRNITRVGPTKTRGMERYNEIDP